MIILQTCMQVWLDEYRIRAPVTDSIKHIWEMLNDINCQTPQRIVQSVSCPEDLKQLS